VPREAARVGASPGRWWLPLAVAAALAGCAAQGLNRAEMDAALYADCVRAGGIWHGDLYSGGNCRFEGRWQ
jgi:hypothetical protein